MTWDDDEWEEFVREWAEYGALQQKYHKVRKLGKANDKGRDVVGYLDDTDDSDWDNYQCKHYDHPLMPSDIWVELGKLCYYTWHGDYKIPRAYYFVAPRGVGTTLHDLLMKPQEIRDQLIANWAEKCEKGISRKAKVPLSDSLKQYVETFDFRIVKYLEPSEVIEQYKQTGFYYIKFGGLPLKAPDPNELIPPPDIATEETRYVEQLLEAYSDREKKKLAKVDDLGAYPKLRRHFDSSREDFYIAEALYRTSRDASVCGCDYDGAVRQIHKAVQNTLDRDHANGYDRLTATTDMAQTVSLHAHVLADHLTPDHKRGMCHQLANKDEISWIDRK